MHVMVLVTINFPIYFIFCKSSREMTMTVDRINYKIIDLFSTENKGSVNSDSSINFRDKDCILNVLI